MKRVPQLLRFTLALLLTTAIALSFLPAAPLTAQAPAVRYLVVAKADKLPNGLADQITAAGGTISAVLPEPGEPIRLSASMPRAAKCSRLCAAWEAFPARRLS